MTLLLGGELALARHVRRDQPALRSRVSPSPDVSIRAAVGAGADAYTPPARGTPSASD